MNVTATLVARSTADGTEFIYEDVPLGKVYLIDLDSLRVGKWYCTARKDVVERETVALLSPDGEIEGWLPTELLKWEVQ